TAFGAAVAGIWALAHTASVAGLFGASSNLTGRTKIWTASWSLAKERLWLGYGYDAFWRGLDGPSAQVWAIVQSTPPHAHNGFLGLWLALGALGVALFTVTLLTGLRSAFRRLRTDRDDVSVFFISMLGFLVFFNITESGLLSRNSIFWIAYVVVSI